MIWLPFGSYYILTDSKKIDSDVDWDLRGEFEEELKVKTTSLYMITKSSFAIEKWERH